MSPSRREVLGGVAGVAGLATGTGCLGGRGPPPLVEAAGVVPVGDGYLAGGTAGRDALDRGPLSTWVAGLAADGRVRFRRRHAPDEWPGDDQVTACCGLGDGALLVGRATREDVVVDDVLVHAVAPDGETRWRRTLPAAATAVDAARVPGGAVVAAVDGGAEPTAWVAGVAGDGRVRWEHRLAGRVPAAVHATGDGRGVTDDGDGRVVTSGGRAVVVGHAVDGRREDPWLLTLDGDNVVARRRYGDLRGWRLAALLGGVDQVRAVAVPLAPATTEGAAGRLVALDGDWRVDGWEPLALADDHIRADDADGDSRPDDPVRFVGALPTGGGGLAAAVGEGGWTTVATFDVDRSRVAETVRQARTAAVHADADGSLLLAGSRRVEEGTRRAWVTRLGTRGTANLRGAERWTATFGVG